MPQIPFRFLQTLALLLLPLVPGAAFAVDAATLQALMNEAVEDGFPGVVLLVETPELRFLEGRGVADREEGTAMGSESLLRIASVTKTYVAALVVMAAQDGVLDLESPIDRYLDPAFLARLPEGPRPSVRQLLDHTSGIPDYYTTGFYASWDKQSPLTTDRIMEVVEGRRATQAPGERFAYSNTNYHVAARILERVHGRSLGELLEERIFGPLDLQETVYDQHRPPGDVIHGYGTPIRKWKDTYEWRESSGPDGGIKASARDVSDWLRALLRSDGALAEVGAIMTAAPIEESERKLQGLGLEILVSREGPRFYGHTGDVYGYLTAAFYSPELDTSVVLHVNRYDREGFRDLLVGVLQRLVG